MSRPANIRRRRSSAASHRLPFWAKTERSLQVYHENPRRDSCKLKRISDYGVDNFSYDPVHLAQWQMPDSNFASYLPEDLLEKTEDWSKAAAAVSTALVRMAESYKQATHSAYPDTQTNIARRASRQAIQGAEATPASSPLASTLSFDPSTLQKANLSLAPTYQKGMESPPYTPYDITTCNTPVNGSFTTSPTTVPRLPDLSALDIELTSLASPPLYLLGFDPVTWETYINHFQEEIRDAQIALQRVKGYTRTVEIMLIERRYVLTPEVKLAVMEFSKWWESLKPKVTNLQEKVKDLEAPRLDDVTAEVEEMQAAERGETLSAVRIVHIDGM